MNIVKLRSHPGLLPVVISKKLPGLAYKLSRISERFRIPRRNKKTYKGFKKPRGELPAATRRSFINAITDVNIGEEQLVPPTRIVSPACKRSSVSASQHEKFQCYINYFQVEPCRWVSWKWHHKRAPDLVLRRLESHGR